MRKTKNTLFVGTAVSLFIGFQINFSAQAGEDTSLLSIGAGISSPSLISTTYNPAGFTANTRSKIDGFSSFSTSTGAKNPQTYGGGFFSGNGKFGGGIQFTRYQTSNSSTVQPGFAFEATSIKTSFGLVCSIQTTSFSLSCNNFGLLFDPKKSFRFGAKIVTSSSSPLVSGGLSFELNKTLTFALDATEDFTYKTTTLTPGLGVNAQNFELMASYSMQLKSASSGSYLFGLGWSLSKDFKLVAYSNFSSSHTAMLMIGI